MHQKVILGNRVPIVEEKLVGYIIDGIPDRALRNETRVSGMAIREDVDGSSKLSRGTRKKRQKAAKENISRDRGTKMKAEGASRGRGTTSIANCPIMSVEIVQRKRKMFPMW